MSVVQLKLRDGSEVTLDSDALIRAASTLEDGDTTRLEVIVQGRRVEAARLVALATGLRSEEIGLSGVQNALRELKLKLFWGDDEIDGPLPDKPLSTSPRVDLPGPIDDPSVLPPSITATMARELQRHRGEWAAIAADRLIGTARNLGELQAKVGDTEATVFWIPTKHSSGDDAE